MQKSYKDYGTEKLVVMYQDTYNEEYLQEVMHRNRGLLYIWAESYINIPFYDIEDLIEEARIALWRAVESFDNGRGVLFASFLEGVVKQHFNRLYNEVTRKKRYNGIELSNYSELDEINEVNSVPFEAYSDLTVKDFIESLNGKLKYIAVCLMEGYTKIDISKALNITPASTTYHIKKLEAIAVEYFGLRV